MLVAFELHQLLFSPCLNAPKILDLLAQHLLQETKEGNAVLEDKSVLEGAAVLEDKGVFEGGAVLEDKSVFEGGAVLEDRGVHEGGAVLEGNAMLLTYLALARRQNRSYATKKVENDRN